MAPLADVEDVMEHLVLEGRTKDTRRLLAHARERGTSATLDQLDATVRALAGDHAGALESIERAAGDPFALVVAAWIRCAVGDLASAERDARRAEHT